MSIFEQFERDESLYKCNFRHFLRNLHDYAAAPFLLPIYHYSPFMKKAIFYQFFAIYCETFGRKENIKDIEPLLEEALDNNCFSWILKIHSDPEWMQFLQSSSKIATIVFDSGLLCYSEELDALRFLKVYTPPDSILRALLGVSIINGDIELVRVILLFPKLQFPIYEYRRFFSMDLVSSSILKLVWSGLFQQNFSTWEFAFENLISSSPDYLKWLRSSQGRSLQSIFAAALRLKALGKPDKSIEYLAIKLIYNERSDLVEEYMKNYPAQDGLHHLNLFAATKLPTFAFLKSLPYLAILRKSITNIFSFSKSSSDLMIRLGTINTQILFKMRLKFMWQQLELARNTIYSERIIQIIDMKDISTLSFEKVFAKEVSFVGSNLVCNTDLKGFINLLSKHLFTNQNKGVYEDFTKHELMEFFGTLIGVAFLRNINVSLNLSSSVYSHILQYDPDKSNGSNLPEENPHIGSLARGFRKVVPVFITKTLDSEELGYLLNNDIIGN